MIRLLMILAGVSLGLAGLTILLCEVLLHFFRYGLYEASNIAFYFAMGKNFLLGTVFFLVCGLVLFIWNLSSRRL